MAAGDGDDADDGEAARAFAASWCCFAGSWSGRRPNVTMKPRTGLFRDAGRKSQHHGDRAARRRAGEEPGAGAHAR